MTKVVKIGDIEAGSEKLFLIAGPCVIEEESIMMKTAEALEKLSSKLDIGITYKPSFQKDNRSNLKYYSGPGLDAGIALLAKIKERFGFPVLTDIHYPDQAAAVRDVVDVIQIPAFLCMQTSLIEAAAKTGRVVNIKHAQFLAPENMKFPVGKCVDSGNDQILVTERGYAFGYNDLIVDPRSFYHLRNTGFPVVFDITHSVRKYGIPSADPRGGMREFLSVLSRAGVAAGVDGLFIETHPEPAKALCDAASQLPLEDIEEFLKPLMELHDVEVSYRST